MAPCLRIFNAKTRKRRESVGRAVHCAPVVSCRHGFSAGILPSAPLRARLRLTAETLRRRESVGRAVHCAPEPGTQTRLLGLNLVFPRSYERGYERVGKARTPLRAESRRAGDCPPYQCNWDGARASTPAEPTLRLTPLHHLISQPQNCPSRKKPRHARLNLRALRPRWPRAKSAQRRATVPVAGDPQPRALRAIAQQQ